MDNSNIIVFFTLVLLGKLFLIILLIKRRRGSSGATITSQSRNAAEEGEVDQTSAPMFYNSTTSVDMVAVPPPVYTAKDQHLERALGPAPPFEEEGRSSHGRRHIIPSRIWPMFSPKAHSRYNVRSTTLPTLGAPESIQSERTDSVMVQIEPPFTFTAAITPHITTTASPAHPSSSSSSSSSPSQHLSTVTSSRPSIGTIGHYFQRQPAQPLLDHTGRSMFFFY